MNQNNDDGFNYDNKLLINSKDCRNFLWILFKATGASLPFELDELDKDTYEEVIKDVIANHMFTDQEEINESFHNNNNNIYMNMNIINNHQESAYLNYSKKSNNLVNELDSLNKKFQDINAPNDKHKINAPAENHNHQPQPMLNNESNFHLFQDNQNSNKKEKEEEKIPSNSNNIKNQEDIVLKEHKIAENNDDQARMKAGNEDSNKISNQDEIADQVKHVEIQDAYINKEEDKKEVEEDVQVIKEDCHQENDKNQESVNQEKSSEEAHNDTNIQIKPEEADVSRLTENDEVLKKYLLLDKTIKLKDLYSNPEVKKNYINGSIDSQFSRESLNDQNDESQSKY
jgi:hypothetical protein